MRQVVLKAIIFDYGKVLSLPPPAVDMDKMAGLLNTSIEEFGKAYYHFRAPYDRGDIAAREYWTTVAGFLGVTSTDDQVKTLSQIDYQMWAHPQEITIAWVQHLHRLGFYTGLLSNMPCDHRQYLDEHCPWLHGFDHRTFSGDVRSAKPSPDIYYHCLHGLNVVPSEALFLDDNEENITAAKNLGMKAILFSNAEAVAAQVELQFAIQLPLRTKATTEAEK